MRIRAAAPADDSAVRSVHLSAFPTAAEADLVDRLVGDGDAVVSIVADDEGNIIGHVLLSRMKVQAEGRQLRALGLAPVAVVPQRQGEGIGSALVEAAVADARRAGADVVFLLGEPEFYSRFGFTAAAAAPFASPYAGPYFQALSFSDLSAVSAGVAAYACAFADLG